MSEEWLSPDLQNEITADDKLWAVLSWIPVSPLYPVVAIILLLLEDKKDRPFIRYNAVVSLATGAVLFVLSFLTFGLAALGYLVCFWWAYQASQGREVNIPFVSDFCRNQGWV